MSDKLPISYDKIDNISQVSIEETKRYLETLSNKYLGKPYQLELRRYLASALAK